MSWVTGLVICFSCSEDYAEQEDGTDKFPVVEKINAWLGERGKMPLVQLDEKMCCGKHPQMHVFGGGYNYLGDEDFLKMFHSLEWQCKESVFMIFNSEENPMEVIRP